MQRENSFTEKLFKQVRLTMAELFKNFAGPIATIIASIITGVIVVYFAVHQKNIAFQQKEIAKEKLRLDLFDRRYKSYESIFDFYNALIDWSGTDNQEASFKRFFRVYQESKFLFGYEVETIFKEILDLGAKVRGFKENRDTFKSDPEFFHQQFMKTNDILINDFDTKLRELTNAAQPYIGFQSSGLSGKIFTASP